MRKLTRIVEIIADTGGDISGGLVLAIMALVFYEVLMRYALNRPTAFSDEYAGYMMVALSFLGIAYAWRKKAHVRITFLTNRLRPRVASWLRLVTLVLVLIFLISQWVANYSFLNTSFGQQMRSNTWLFTPLQIPHSTITIGIIILSFIVIVEIARTIIKFKNSTWEQVR